MGVVFVGKILNVLSLFPFEQYGLSDDVFEHFVYLINAVLRFDK